MKKDVELVHRKTGLGRQRNLTIWLYSFNEYMWPAHEDRIRDRDTLLTAQQAYADCCNQSTLRLCMYVWKRRGALVDEHIHYRTMARGRTWIPHSRVRTPGRRGFYQ